MPRPGAVARRTDRSRAYPRRRQCPRLDCRVSDRSPCSKGPPLAAIDRYASDDDTPRADQVIFLTPAPAGRTTSAPSRARRPFCPPHRLPGRRRRDPEPVTADHLGCHLMLACDPAGLKPPAVDTNASSQSGPGAPSRMSAIAQRSQRWVGAAAGGTDARRPGKHARAPTPDVGLGPQRDPRPACSAPGGASADSGSRARA
jgi:hypothetical protein